METSKAIKIGIVAGIVSALFPSIPTIISFRYWENEWFRIYTLVGLLLLLGLML